MKIAFIGAGNVARALGALFHRAGHQVLFGSKQGAPTEVGRAVSLEEAASEGEVVVLAVPFVATHELLPALRARLRGKLVIDATNPVNGDWSPLLLGEQSSAGEEISRLLSESRVVKAFNTIFADVMRADRLTREGSLVNCFIASEDPEAALTVAQLAQVVGMAPVTAGPLRAARHLESLAHLNIQLAVGMKGGTDAAFIYHQRRG